MTSTNPLATKVARALQGNDFTPASVLEVIEDGYVFGRVVFFSPRTVCFRVHAASPFQFIADPRSGRVVFELYVEDEPPRWESFTKTSDHSPSYRPWRRLAKLLLDVMS